MKYRKLGNSEMRVSEIGFGCMSLDTEGSNTDALIGRAIDAGINFFDTADLYQRGQNEESVGRALQSYRKDIIIATKVGNQWKPDESGWVWNPTKEYILSAVDLSLKRLKTDTIDLYQLHGGTVDDPIDDIIEAFERLKDLGKIRYYGISSIRPNVIREYLSRSQISSVMMQYSLLDRRPEEHCLKDISDSGASVLARGTLAKGLMIDKDPEEYLGYRRDQVSRLQKKLNETGHPVGASLGFALDHPALTSAVVGLRTIGQLTGILQGYHELPDREVIKNLTNILDRKRYEKHR